MLHLIVPMLLSLFLVMGAIFWWGGGVIKLQAFGVLLISVLLIVAFLSALLLREFSRLCAAAQAFGEGNYGIRLSPYPYSPLTIVNQAFNTMADRTQRSIDAQRELTAAVSHELRTPIARLRFALEILAVTTDEEKKQHHISEMNTDMDELGQLLSELLVYARLDAQQGQVVHPVIVEVKAWFSQCKAQWVFLPSDKIIEWCCDASIAVDEMARFDADLMRRALGNLVQNAYHHAHQYVAVTLGKSDEHYVLRVADDGVGIPEVDRQRLFEAFAVGEISRNKCNTGFGLGLAIVKRVLNAHGGSVHIEDSLLGGAQFSMYLPIIRALPESPN